MGEVPLAAVSEAGRGGADLRCYTVRMDMEAHATDNEAQFDELTYEAVREPELDPTLGLILESLRRREPTMTIT